MSNRTLNIFTGIIIACIFTLLLVNYLPPLSTFEEETYLSPYGVNGAEVVHNNKPYTLNFDQQNGFVSLINRGSRIGLELIKKNQKLLPYSKIVIYQFEKKPVTLTPITVVDDHIIFEAPQWNPNGYIQDNSGGELLKMLSKTFDS